ncbi:Ankyrin repeat protein 1 [Giardia muris]|uniref:Ankyrin repeat protein 1 n=1 Tax=Giardia muris TaxID=5742 RepID=A0A4Z1T7K5_GIAMU|nr:Ankyrin repeat protein 1 [Giardia muris]|eukprot:TNJ28481.1 Ankyrin repeat protein 1 [Giardia muris]
MRPLVDLGVCVDDPSIAYAPDEGLVGRLVPAPGICDEVWQAMQINSSGLITSFTMVEGEGEEAFSFEQLVHGPNLADLCAEHDFTCIPFHPDEIWSIFVQVLTTVQDLRQSYGHCGLKLWQLLDIRPEMVFISSRGQVLLRPRRTKFPDEMTEALTFKDIGLLLLRVVNAGHDLSPNTELELTDEAYGRLLALPFGLGTYVIRLIEAPTVSLDIARILSLKHVRQVLGAIEQSCSLSQGEKDILFDTSLQDDPRTIAQLPLLAKRQNIHYKTALMSAAAQGEPFSDTLLYWEAGVQNRYGWTALMYAIASGNRDAASRLAVMEAGYVAGGRPGTGPIPIPSMGTSRHGAMLARTTALILSIQHQDYDLALYLSDFEGGDCDSVGYTALMYAIQHGQERIATKLIEKDGGTRAMDNNFALRLATLHGMRNICSRLLDREKNFGKLTGYTPLHRAIAVHDDETFLVAKYKYSTDADYEGLTPLMVAAIFDEGKYASTLLETEAVFESLLSRTTYSFGRDVTGSIATGSETGSEHENVGLTALDLALRHGSEGIVARVIVSRICGYFEMVDDLTDETTLICLVRYLLPELSERERALVEKGRLRELWFCAAETGNLVLLYLLREKYICKLDSDGQTALMRAALADKPESISFLQPEACHISTRGLTALMLAIISNKTTVVPLLAPLEAATRSGAQYHGGAGVTALELAVRYGRSAFLPLLAL